MKILILTMLLGGNSYAQYDFAAALSAQNQLINNGYSKQPYSNTYSKQVTDTNGKQQTCKAVSRCDSWGNCKLIQICE